MERDVASFRDEYRRTEIGSRYWGWGHFAVTTLGALTAMSIAFSLVRRPSSFELALIPVFIVIANLAEYFGHKGPMHHRRRGLGLVFERHTLQHHAFFSDRNMACESSRDFKIVLFPPILLAFFIGAIATPLGALFYVCISPNAGFLFAGVAIGYFLLYEWLHFAYHRPETSWVTRMPGLAQLREHHQMHHRPELMTRCNFNLTFPLGDWILGTDWRSVERRRSQSMR